MRKNIKHTRYLRKTKKKRKAFIFVKKYLRQCVKKKKKVGGKKGKEIILKEDENIFVSQYPFQSSCLWVHPKKLKEKYQAGMRNISSCYQQIELTPIY